MASDELLAINQQVDESAKELADVNAVIADLLAQADDRRMNPDRLARTAFRLAQLPASLVPRNLSEPQREAFEDLLETSAALQSAHVRLEERAAMLARLRETAAAKRSELDRARSRAQMLAAAAAAGDAKTKEAEVAVLQSLANDVANAQATLAQLVASTMTAAGKATPGAWSLPLKGVITQPFGPSGLALEPGAMFQGTYYPHFHAAIDIAGAFGMPVTAAADGVVTFVGHLPDGAEIVLIAHAGGYVSEYAHLDDTFLPPAVSAGRTVAAGQVIGFVGLTGVTTGPHLHFAVLRTGQPIDPLTVIAGS